MKYHTLEEVFHFTEEELKLNKNGIMSEEQRKRLKRGAKMVFIVLSLLGILLAFGFYKISESNGNPSILGTIIVLVLIIGTGIFFGIRASRAASNAKINKVTGTVIFVFRNRSYQIIVNGIQLPALVTAKNLFIPNVEYDIYYSDDLSILSVEEK